MNEQTNNLAFIFPGQGSQSLGMLKDLANSHIEIKHTFIKCLPTYYFNILLMSAFSFINMDKYDASNISRFPS